ncbi:MAG: FtsX-like permease family protein [Saprospiraceae bacterium]
MLKHLFKLIWKKKKTNFLMMLEIFVSFLILFAAWSLGLFYYRNYSQPEGSSTENVWALYCGFGTDTMREQNKELIRQKLKSYPQVESFAFSESNVPFGFSSSNRRFEYQQTTVHADFMQVDPEIVEVLQLKLRSGTFPDAADNLNKFRPAIINLAFNNKLFRNENALGKVLNEKSEYPEERMQVVGIVENFKFKSDFQEIAPCVLTTGDKWSSVCLVKVKSETDVNFEAKLSKELLNLGKDWSIEVQHMDNMKTNQNKIALIPILILFIVYSFLVFNVALGLFGVLFQTINRRRGEIGVRRAMGATKNDILWQFTGETLVIATFGMSLGLFFAIQFPLLHVFDNRVPWFLAILCAIISVYILVILCAILPSRQAAMIYPAVALHED